jgi:hypothetical protein
MGSCLFSSIRPQKRHSCKDTAGQNSKKRRGGGFRTTVFFKAKQPCVGCARLGSGRNGLHLVKSPHRHGVFTGLMVVCIEVNPITYCYYIHYK